MSDFIERNDLQSTDEAWLVVDKDQWPDEQLLKLHQWSQTSKNYGFALSNPFFELWLLLHFEDTAGVTTAEQYRTRLKNHLPEYDKHIHPSMMTADQILEAADRAEARDRPPCADWPREPNKTTVYRLVKKMLAARAVN